VRATLGWVRGPGAESCVGPIELGRRVEGIIGPVLVSASGGQVAVEGRIDRVGERYVATIAVSDAGGRLLGRREVQGAANDCRALDDSIAFVIAVTVDPNAALAELPGEFAAGSDPGAELLAGLEQQPPQPAGFERTPASARSEPQPPRRRGAQDEGVELGFGAGLGPSGVLGALPDAAVGVAAEVGLRTGVFWHRARGVLPPSQRIALRGGAAAELSAIALSLSTCPRLLAGAGFELAACGGFAAMRLLAEPQGFTGRAQERWLFGPTAGLRLGRELVGPLHVALLAEGQSLWPRKRIVYELGGDEITIQRVSAVLGQLLLALELHF
jgi:hypothetical protein